MASAGLDPAGVFSIRYKFTLPPNRVREFEVRLRRDTLALIVDARDSLPEWTRLTHEQCPNCPLRSEVHPHCPVAVNLVEVVEFFKDVWSCEEAEVEICIEDRTCTKRTAVQNALRGLAGIYMVTSGCPILDKLRPMVYTHAPFASLEETLYRAVAMYCLAQFFRKQRGVAPDWELTGLAKIYEDIGVVNGAFHRRILGVSPKEAGRNALIQLDAYAQYASSRLLREGLGQIERFFASHLADTPGE